MVSRWMFERAERWFLRSFYFAGGSGSSIMHSNLLVMSLDSGLVFVE
jgi:hypothetical protein